MLGLAIISASYTILGGLKGNIKSECLSKYNWSRCIYNYSSVFYFVTKNTDTTLQNYLTFDFKVYFGHIFVLAFTSNILFSLFWQFVV